MPPKKDADDLASLPEADEDESDTKSAVMKTYFNGATKRSTVKWKQVGILIVLFVVLSLPMLSGMWCKVPYCDGETMQLVVRTVVFAVLVIAVMWFM